MKMDKLQLLKAAIEEKFRADCVIKELADKIKRQAEVITFEKYKDVKLTCDGMRFELAGVRSSFIIWDTEIPSVEITLHFVVYSKIPKAKQVKVDEYRSSLKNKSGLLWNTYKIPLWYVLSYRVEIENVLSENINLNISLK